MIFNLIRHSRLIGFASLTVYGIDWVYHPGSLYLSDGREYQPDAVLRNAHTYGQDVLFEVKGYGVPGIDKAVLCQEDNPDKIVLIGRPPYLCADYANVYPAAVWHRPTEPEEFVWNLNGQDRLYVSGEQATSETPGLKFYKALANSRRIM